LRVHAISLRNPAWARARSPSPPTGLAVGRSAQSAVCRKVRMPTETARA
jgi:hypothetical protein